MVLIGTIRPRETATAVVEASTLEEAHQLLEQQAPAGFVLTDAPVRMGAGTDMLTATGTYSRRDGARDIEAADMNALRAQVPDGWILLHVRSV